jgi:hypothetical protein
MSNHEVTASHPLLNKDGGLNEPGWSRKPVQIYDRNAIKASKLRIKEWDYYIILAKDFGVALTISACSPSRFLISPNRRKQRKPC